MRTFLASECVKTGRDVRGVNTLVRWPLKPERLVDVDDGSMDASSKISSTRAASKVWQEVSYRRMEVDFIGQCNSLLFEFNEFTFFY